MIDDYAILSVWELQQKRRETTFSKTALLRKDPLFLIRCRVSKRPRTAPALSQPFFTTEVKQNMLWNASLHFPWPNTAQK